eukprot:scaffold12324_cov101-Isochrysis_galbana.AAC.1
MDGGRGKQARDARRRAISVTLVTLRLCARGAPCQRLGAGIVGGVPPKLRSSPRPTLPLNTRRDSLPTPAALMPIASGASPTPKGLACGCSIRNPAAKSLGCRVAPQRSSSMYSSRAEWPAATTTASHRSRSPLASRTPVTTPPPREASKGGKAAGGPPARDDGAVACRADACSPGATPPASLLDASPVDESPADQSEMDKSGKDASKTDASLEDTSGVDTSASSSVSTLASHMTRAPRCISSARKFLRRRTRLSVPRWGAPSVRIRAGAPKFTSVSSTWRTCATGERGGGR